MPAIRAFVLLMLLARCAFASSYDLSGLADYQPPKNLLGVIRVHGSQLTIRLIHRWEEDFLERHPDIRYRENLLPSWFSGMCAATQAPPVMGHHAGHPA